MENISLLLSSSDSSGGNGSLIREFPYQRPTLAVSLLLNTITLSGIILIIFLPLATDRIYRNHNEGATQGFEFGSCVTANHINS